MRYLLCFLGTAVAFLQSLSLPGLFPSFLPSDFAPYLSTPVYQPGPLVFSLTTSSSYEVMVNSTYIGSFLGNKTITVPGLTIGAHALSISNGGFTYMVTVLVGGNQTFTHSVAAGTANCAPNCTIQNSQTWTVTSSAPVQVLVFNGVARVGMWVPLQGSQNFVSSALDNYMVVLEGSGMQVHTGYKLPKTNQPSSLLWKTAAFAGFELTPRFHPQLSSYVLTPMLSTTVGFGVSLQTTCGAQCSISVDSSAGIFPTASLISSAWSSALTIQQNDTVILTYTDTSGALSPQYYAISVNVLSRDRFLKLLKVVAGTKGDNYAGYANSGALQTDVVGTQVALNEVFSSIRTAYTLPDLDYNPALALVVIADTSSAFSSLTIRSNSTLLAAYWTSPKVFVPLIGLNLISVTITAQDPGYYETITIAYKMLGNNTDIEAVDIPGALWDVPFTPAGTQYVIGMPASWTSFPMVVKSSDPKSLISVYGTFILPGQNYTGLFNSSITLPSLPFYNQSITLLISAETRSIHRQVVLWVWKQDRCGNGLRYSSTEHCDDGNLVNGDGCNANCQVEAGAQCSGGSLNSADLCTIQPVNCTDPNSVNCTTPTDPSNCTDGGNCTNPVPPSNCTDGFNCTNTPPNTNCTEGFNCTNTPPDTNCTSNPQNCTDPRPCENPADQNCTQPPSNCTNSTSSLNCTEASCGDGFVDPGEQCDDGNVLDGDGCSHTCQIESLCGNGMRDSGETCDDGNRVSGDGCSSTCTLELSWECVFTPNLHKDVCALVPSALIYTSAEPYFDYQYMGVGFGFPFVVLLIATLIVVVWNHLKAISLPIWLPAGLCYLIMLLQLLFILHEVNLQDPRAQIFSGFSWSHLRFSVDYPPFHSRLLVGLQPNERVRFLDYTLVFLLIILVTVLTHVVCKAVVKPWGCVDDWAKIYFILFQLVHIPVIYYAVQSLTHVSALTSVYDNINVTAALIVLAAFIGVLLLYVFAFHKAWSIGAMQLSPSVRSILCPGVKKPEEHYKCHILKPSAAELKASNDPQRPNQSFDETVFKDKDGADDVAEETTVRVFSADTSLKKKGLPKKVTPSVAKAMRGVLRTWAYVLQLTETTISAVVLAAGSTRLGKVIPVLLLEIALAGYLIWQRPFEKWRYNVLQSCLRIAFAAVLLLQAIDSQADEAATIVFVFIVLVGIFAAEVSEFCLLLHTHVTHVRTPLKSPVPKPADAIGVPDIRPFSINVEEDRFSIEVPDIPDERHSSSEEVEVVEAANEI